MRADRLHRRRCDAATMCLPSSMVRTAAACGVLLLCSVVHAQPAQPGDDPTRAYTPVTGLPTPLVPQASDAVPGRSTVFASGPYAANAAVARIVVEVERNAIPADGQTPVGVTVRLFDADGKPLAVPAFATIEHSGGRVLLPGARTDEAGPLARDADRRVPGVQLPVADGTARFTLLAPYEPQDVRLRITAGAHEAEGVISYVPEVREMIAAGLIEGIVNFRGNLRDAISPRGDGFEQDIRRWEREFNDGKANAAARAAVFVKGVIRGDVLLTAAYDSDKDTRQRLLRDVRPEEFYPVYGDSSLKGFDARSAERLYVRIDKQRSYLLYGDFQTGDGFSQRSGGGAVAGLPQRSLGAYNRSVTGARGHFEQGSVVGNVFAFRDSLRQVVEEFASQGSGPYGLANDAVYEGSEKVEVVVRDRNQPSRILRVTPLQRLVDYSFEPFSGRIVLATFLPSLDADLNPVSLRVSYEVDQGGPTFWVTGVDGQWQVNDRLEVGGNWVSDRNPLAEYDLASANATVRLGDRTVLAVEVARSQAEVNTNPSNTSPLPGLQTEIGRVTGQAWRVELGHQGERFDARLFIGRSDVDFVNPSAPLAGGRGEAEVRLGYQLTDSVRLFAEALGSEDRNDGGGRREAAQVGAQVKLSDRVTLDAGVRGIRETAGTIGSDLNGPPFGSTAGLTGSLASGSGGGALGLGNQLIDPGTGLPIINPGTMVPGTGGTAHAGELRSTSVRMGVGWRATDLLTLGAEVEHEVDGEERRRIALGGDYQVGERTRLYGRYERQTGLSGPYAITTAERTADAFVFGVDSTVMRDTQLFSEYRLRDALAGRDTQLASGVRNTWDVADGWRLHTAFERIRVLSGDVPDTVGAAVGVDYTAHPLWKGSTRLELRRAGDSDATTEDDRFRTTLWQVMAARKLDRDWTLLGRNYLLLTDYAARGDVLQNRAQVGVAYRDTDTNRINALAKYEYKLEQDASDAAAGDLRSRAHIVSTHADWHPSRPWWLTGRAAAKWQADRLEGGVRDDFRAQLLAGRVVYDVTERWDVGLLAATQFGQHGARQHAAGAELGYLLRQNLWLSAGWNHTGFAADRDLAGAEYTDRGFYIRLRFKFDENLLRGDDPAVNRALER